MTKIIKTEANMELRVINKDTSDAVVFIEKINEAFKQRSTNKIKDAINVVDDVLGMDTRETIKGVMENGVVNSLLKGIKKK